MRIWHHCIHYSDAALADVMAGPWTHVLLSGKREASLALWKPYVERVRDAKKTPILCRWLWSVDDPEQRMDIFDWVHYANTLARTRGDAEQLGCESAIDTEPYGGDTTAHRMQKLNAKEWYLMRRVCDDAATAVGQVQYLLPAHFPYPRHTTTYYHMSRAVEGLGVKTVAEHTYYTYPTVTPCTDETFSIFGAYVDTDPVGKPEPFDHAYTPKMVRERLWGRDLMVYPCEENKAAVAAVFKEIA